METTNRRTGYSSFSGNKILIVFKNVSILDEGYKLGCHDPDQDEIQNNILGDQEDEEDPYNDDQVDK